MRVCVKTHTHTHGVLGFVQGRRVLASDVLRVWRVLWFYSSGRSQLRHSYMRENACIFIWVSVCDQGLMYDGDTRCL